uniref:Reverse transcriptase domain-containing protein n=1 Tax=Cannabis sativa TaxID=3483 RepID=A0A803QKQ2_CANSA
MDIPNSLDVLNGDSLLKIPLWVQVFNTSFLKRSEELAILVSSSLGHLLEIYRPSFRETWGPYFRLRVMFEVAQPLPRGIPVHFSGINKVVWLELKYENLPDICFFCGRMRHSYNKGCMDYMKACDEALFPPELSKRLEAMNLTYQPGVATPTGSKASKKTNKPDSKDKFKRQTEMVNGEFAIKSFIPPRQTLLNTSKLSSKDNPGHPWIIMGDFNAFLFSQDKQGDATLSHLGFFGSDHQALELVTSTPPGSRMKDKSKRFHFENVWLKDPNWSQMFDQSRLPSTTSRPSLISLQHTPCALEVSAIGITKKISISKSTLVRLRKIWKWPAQLLFWDDRTIANIKDLQSKLEALLYKEETYWKQRARTQWLAQGDKNTRFFHRCTSHRKKINKIHKLHSPNGGIISDEEDSNKALLNEEFALDEIEKVFFQLPLDKAPGPDGFNSNFYKATWSTVRNDVLNAASSFLNGNGDVAPLNTTLITLIPKVKQPTSISEFQPISLCNIVYKIISKTIDNRLKLVLNNLISPNQSAFLPGRLISDNIIIAQEVAHSIKLKSRGKTRWMAVKLDMAKAFDRVEWPFIVAILRKFQFPYRFIQLIFACISTSTFQLNFNGKVVGSVIPSRGNGQNTSTTRDHWISGIRQVTPISPVPDKVESFITNSMTWDITTLHRYYPPHVVEQILAIPLPLTPSPDDQIWEYSKSGVYSVRFGYHLSLSSTSPPNIPSSSSPSPWRKNLWHLNLPAKVKHFAFRATNSTLPTAKNLAYRKIIHSPGCDRCGNLEESVSHALFYCQSIRRVSKGTQLYPYIFSCSSEIMFHDIADMIYTSLTKEEVELFLCTAWFIWFNRNKALKGQAQDQAHAILNLAHSYLAEFNSSLSASAPTSRPRHSLATTTWSPPASGLLKLNVDAAVSKNDGKAGFGGVIRNSEGLVVAALAQPYIGRGVVATLEAKSFLSMRRWCIDEHFQVQEVETDCKAIADALSHNKEDFTVFGYLICQIKEVLSLIPSARLSHVNRGANYLANKLAHRALGLDEVAIWIGDDPCDLIEFLSL